MTVTDESDSFRVGKYKSFWRKVDSTKREHFVRSRFGYEILTFALDLGSKCAFNASSFPIVNVIIELQAFTLPIFRMQL